LSAHVQLFIHQYPQALLLRAAFNLFIPQSVLISGVAPTQVQDLALGLVEPHDVEQSIKDQSLCYLLPLLWSANLFIPVVL